MSLLTKPDIISNIKWGFIRVYADDVLQTPDMLRIGPNSLDLHLHRDLRVYTRKTADAFLDVKKDNPTELRTIPRNGYILSPGVLYLGRSIERVYTSNCIPALDGRSTSGRLGISVHQSAGRGDVGFDGVWTMGISVVEPVRVYPEMRIAQLWFHTMSSPLQSKDKYRGSYQGQREPTAAKASK